MQFIEPTSVVVESPSIALEVARTNNSTSKAVEVIELVSNSSMSETNQIIAHLKKLNTSKTESIEITLNESIEITL